MDRVAQSTYELKGFGALKKALIFGKILRAEGAFRKDLMHILFHGDDLVYTVRI